MKTLYSTLLTATLGLTATASTPNFNLHCEIRGELVKFAESTVPAKASPTDDKLEVNLHLRGTLNGFHTTGPDYFVHLKQKQGTVLVYLHSSGYEFPLEKSVGIHVTGTDGRGHLLFITTLPDGGNMFITPQLLQPFGVSLPPQSATPLAVTCRDYGSA